MNSVKFIVPEKHSKSGSVVEIPAEDAAQFDEIGWKRVDAPKKKETKA